MIDFFSYLYPWTKALHVMSVIAWMAAIFYLPRLFVYHVEKTKDEPALAKHFEEMELKLSKVIMLPAMHSTWLFGLILVATPGIVDWSAAWSWIKALMVISMTIYHLWCSRQRKRLLNGTNTMTGRQLRMANEVPTVLMMIIVIMIIVRPF